MLFANLLSKFDAGVVDLDLLLFIEKEDPRPKASLFLMYSFCSYNFIPLLADVFDKFLSCPGITEDLNVLVNLIGLSAD